VTASCGPFCEAKKRQGPGTCHKPAGWGTDHVGYGACRLHGGSTAAGRRRGETLREAAWDRILAMADPALDELRRLLDGESEEVRLRAVKDILDRAGLGARHVHEHTGPDGGPIPVEVRIAALLKRADRFRRRAIPAESPEAEA